MKTVLFFILVVGAVHTIDVKILSPVKASDRGPDPCTSLCIGSTGWDTAWIDQLSYINAYINYSGCGFKDGTTPKNTTPVALF